ncbi:MAG: hypothetical protein ACKO96_35025, partial [Flammeovirgaceae bacterium]
IPLLDCTVPTNFEKLIYRSRGFIRDLSFEVCLQYQSWLVKRRTILVQFIAIQQIFGIMSGLVLLQYAQ